MQNIELNLQTLGKALSESQCKKVYYYPGMKGDVLASAIDGQIKPSLNERNAFEFGYGACLAGARTTVIMKAVGLATCLDSVQHAVIQGVYAGMVLVILEDTVAASSPEIVDSRLLADYAATMVIEPSSMESAVQHLRDVFALSEKIDVPIIVRLTHDLLNSNPVEPTAYTPKQQNIGPKPSYRQKMIGAWHERSKKYERKLDQIDLYIDNIYRPMSGKAFSSIYFGYKKDLSPKTLVVEHYPVAQSLREAYAQHEVPVYELGSNYASQKLRSHERLRIDNSRALVTDVVPLDDWEKALKLVDKQAYDYVVGDEGKFTLDSTNLVDICLCMGSSISVCAGISDVTGVKNLTIIGDFSYMFNAYPSILEAYCRGIVMDILVLDDGRASSTGGQSSIAPVELQAIATFAGVKKPHDYENLPSKLFGPNASSINICHVKKRTNA